jgi:gamma-glutamyltranspeptidase / glutathione hydrolase
MKLRLLTICLMGLLPLMSYETRADEPPVGGYDRPVGHPQQSRSVVLARNGMVATSHPLAAQVGLQVLQNGGNAADAAIAVNAMLGVVEPMMCGIGGDLFCIYWDNETQKLYGLNASGRSPFEISVEKIREKDLDQIPVESPLSWSVPGCVSGWDALNQRFGSRPLGELLQPAIETAEEGFAVTEVVAGYWSEAEEKLAADPARQKPTFSTAGRRDSARSFACQSWPSRTG